MRSRFIIIDALAESQEKILHEQIDKYNKYCWEITLVYIRCLRKCNFLYKLLKLLFRSLNIILFINVFRKFESSIYLLYKYILIFSRNSFIFLYHYCEKEKFTKDLIWYILTCYSTNYIIIAKKIKWSQYKTYYAMCFVVLEITTLYHITSLLENSE